MDIDSDDDEPPTLVNVDGSYSASTPPPMVEDDENLPPCPVTILSGFLGSGKTTLIQYILRSPNHGKRIAVIENEYGQGLAIESLIARDGVDNSSLTDLIELPNGCICCTVKDSLVTTLEALLDKRRDLDYILIECSGMANPGPIASLFWLDDALQSRLRLDGIVTVCDAKHLPQQLVRTKEAAQQIAHADRILLNKMDLVPPDRADILERHIRTFHPTAPLLRTSHSAVPDLDWILNAQCLDGSKVKDVLDLAATTDDAESHNHNHDHDHHNSQNCAVCSTHEHTSDISTISLVRPNASVDRQLLDRWLASILWPNQDAQDKVLRQWLEQQHAGAETELPHAAATATNNEQSIFRIKGVVSVRHNTTDDSIVDMDDETLSYMESGTRLDRRQFIVQGVHDLWDIYPASNAEWSDQEPKCCKLVIIGRFLDRSKLAAGLDACLV